MQAQYAMQQQITEEIAQAEVARTQAVYAGRQAVAEYGRGVTEATRQLDVERATVTGTAAQRALAVDYLRIELELERQIDAIRKNSGFDQADRDEQEAKARATAEQARSNARQRAELDHIADTRDALKRTVEQYEQGLTNAAMQGGKSVREYIEGTFRTTAIRIILNPVINWGAQALTLLTGGTSGTAGSASASDAGSMLSTGSTIWNALTNGVSSSISSAFAKFAGSSVGQTLGLSNSAAIAGNNPSAFVPAGGQLTSLGSSISAGLGMAGNALAGYGISSAISNGYTTGGNTVNVLSGIASAFLGPVAGVVGGLINRAFGRKLKDVGVEGTLGGAEGFEGQQYAFYKGGWLRSDKTSYSALDSDTSRQLADSFRAIQAQVGTFAETLGLNTDKIASFTTALKVSTNGLDEAGIAEAFQDALAKGSNELAQQVLGTWTSTSEDVERVITRGMTDAFDGSIETITETVSRSTYVASEYAKAGEEAIDTLSRLANSFTTVNALSDAMGYGFHEASLAGAAAASNLADAFGGLEAFTRTLGAYVENYYTSEEQRAATARQVSRALSDVGLQFSAEQLLTATRPQIRAFVEGVAEQFGFESKEYVAAVTQANALASITAPLESAVQTVSAASTAMSDALRDAAEAAQRIADERKGLQDQIDELTMSRAELIAKERAALDESNRALFDRLTALQEEARITEERKDLQDQIDELAMNRAGLIAKERAALDESNRALFDRLTALQEEARIAEERTNIEQNWLTAINAAAELRRRELSAIDPANQALQRLISRLADMQTAATTAAARVDAGYSGLQRSVDAEKKALAERLEANKEALAAQQEAASDAVNGIQSIFDTIQSAIQATTVESDTLDRARRDAALAAVRSAQALAAAGTRVDQIAGLKDALGVLSKPTDKLYGRFEDYARAQDEAADAMRQLGDQAEDQLTTAEKALKASEAAAKTLDEQYQLDVATLDQTLEYWRDQIDESRGINTSVLSVRDAVAQLTAALLAQKAASSAATAATSLAAYSPSQVVGAVDYVRGAAERGDIMSVYQGAAANGLNVDQITAVIGLAGYDVGTDDVRAWIAANGLEALPEAKKFATGAAFLGHGVYQRPTAIDIGQMAEAGPEALLPLANVGGKLGVLSAGGGDPAPVVEQLMALGTQLAEIIANTGASAVHAFTGAKATQELIDRGITVRTDADEPLAVA